MKNENTVANDVHYMHFPEASHRCTVAFKTNPTSDGNTVLSYAVAACNVRDNFNKALGREIAQGRLNKGKGSTTVILPTQSREALNEALAHLVTADLEVKLADRTAYVSKSSQTMRLSDFRMVSNGLFPELRF